MKHHVLISWCLFIILNASVVPQTDFLSFLAIIFFFFSFNLISPFTLIKISPSLRACDSYLFILKPAD